MVARIAPRLGLETWVEPEHRFVGEVRLPDGRRTYFRHNAFDLNPQGASEVARDKDYAAQIMARLGYPVPEGQTFYSAEWCRAIGSNRDANAAAAYARTVGFPLVVKPNSESNGMGVTRVHGVRELRQALGLVYRRARDRVALVQRPIAGDDYRLVVLDDALICAYRRAPLAVTGDGRSTIRELLAAHIAALNAIGRDVPVGDDDPRLRARLRRARLGLDSRPPAKTQVVLLDNANLSTGGEATDVTGSLHPEFAALAIRLARDLRLRLCGVDLMTAEPIDQPPSHYTIVEVNAAPGLDHFARLGPTQQAVVERMYEHLLRALIAIPPA